MHALTPETYADLARLVEELCGVVLGPDKAYLVRHRLEPLLKQENIATFVELVSRARSLGQATLRDQIIDAITTRETSFFRDDGPFDAVRSVWLVNIFKQLELSKTKRARIWSAACSHGQEPYSLAMILREFCDTYFEKNPTTLNPIDRFSILATDVSPEALRLARQAKFSTSELARGLSPKLIERHFDLDGAGRYTLRSDVRKIVEFVRHNLLLSNNPGLKLGFFDLILCRNVLIYFEDRVKQRVIKTLADALQPGGILIIGAAESLHNVPHTLRPIRLGNSVAYQRPE